MPEPFITPLIIGGLLGALSSTTVKWSEIDAWTKGKCPGLKAPKGRATITWEKAAGEQVIVTATVYSLRDGFLSTKMVPLDSKKWTADRLEPALARKFNGRQQSFNVELTRPSAQA
jgi:hypothetical protein